ncbi:hypothetical protein RO064_000364 [Salmonella enterica]|nr:hypothetical protein [Salmonella enterica]EKY8631598.1 hypothetical protein [Salmonella enterica]ELH3211364.1 hypothetical protein [Salmonella enterica]
MRTVLDKDDLNDSLDYSWTIRMGTRLLVLSWALEAHEFSFDIKDRFRESRDTIGVSFDVKFNRKDFLLTIKHSWNYLCERKSISDESNIKFTDIQVEFNPSDIISKSSAEENFLTLYFKLSHILIKDFPMLSISMLDDNSFDPNNPTITLHNAYVYEEDDGLSINLKLIFDCLNKLYTW